MGIYQHLTLKLKDIAEKLDVPSGTIRRWKSTYKWDGERSEKITNVRNGKRGGQPNNKNAVGSGAPEKKHKCNQAWTVF